MKWNKPRLREMKGKIAQAGKTDCVTGSVHSSLCTTGISAGVFPGSGRCAVGNGATTSCGHGPGVAY